MKVLGIDVDGTLCPDKPFDVCKIPAPLAWARDLLMVLTRAGYTVCIWSCRPTYMLEAWLAEHGLKEFVSGVNSSPLPGDDRKLPFHVYIDNAALQFPTRTEFDGWDIQWLLGELERRSYPNFGPRDTDFCDQTPPLMLRGTGTRYLDEFDTKWRAIWGQRLKLYDDCLLTICSHAKPYAKSYIHMAIRKRLWRTGWLNKLDYVHISNAGIIPTEHGTTYPFDSYDWDNSKASPAAVVALRARIADNLLWWYEHVGSSYQNLYIYLRTPGNTSSTAEQVLGDKPNVRLCFVPARRLPYALEHDADDTLADDRSLDVLVRCMRKEQV